MPIRYYFCSFNCIGHMEKQTNEKQNLQNSGVEEK